jgi:hypothetical protein
MTKEIDYNYALIRPFEIYPIDNTIVVGKGDVEIDMCEQDIVGISINSTNVIRNIINRNEYVVVKLESCEEAFDESNICSVDSVLCGRAQVFVYRNEKDEILQLVIYEPCDTEMLAVELERLSVLPSTHTFKT